MLFLFSLEKKLFSRKSRVLFLRSWHSYLIFTVWSILDILVNNCCCIPQKKKKNRFIYSLYEAAVRPKTTWFDHQMCLAQTQPRSVKSAEANHSISPNFNCFQNMLLSVEIVRGVRWWYVKKMAAPVIVRVQLSLMVTRDLPDLFWRMCVPFVWSQSSAAFSY